MPTFQDPSDPIVDSDGVIQFSHLGFDHVPQTERIRLGSDDWILGKAYTLAQPIAPPQFVVRSGAVFLREETPHPSERLSAGHDFSPWDASTYRHTFFVLCGQHNPAFGGMPFVHMMNMRSGDTWQVTARAATLLLTPVPRMIATSKIRDLRTKVLPEATVTSRTRDLQFRVGYLFSRRGLDPRVLARLGEHVNAHFQRIESPFAVPEERPARELPSSSPERTEVPAPEPEPDAVSPSVTDPDEARARLEPSSPARPPTPDQMSIVEETLRSLQAMELDRRRQRERDAIASGILGGAIATSNPYLQSGWANSYATYSSVTSSNASSNPNS